MKMVVTTTPICDHLTKSLFAGFLLIYVPYISNDMIELVAMS